MRRFIVWTTLMLPVPLAAQSLLYRAPNMGGTWVPDAAVVQFNFLHRFYVSPSPANGFNNFPTFTLAAGIGHGLSFGTMFATKGIHYYDIANASSTNETELFARWRVWGGAEGQPGFNIAFTPAYNFAAQSVDGDVQVDWNWRRLTLSGSIRMAQHALGSDNKARSALGGGVVLRATRYIALSGDVASFMSPTVHAAWSAAVNFQIPGAPHTFSLQASSAISNTIQGSSIGCVESSVCPKSVLYGFEFTIPLHLKRFGPWFGKESSHATAGAGGPVAVTIDVRSMGFRTDSVTIQAGQSVRWNNQDPLVHTVTFDDPNEPGSGEIAVGGGYTKRFEKPGVYHYHCLPHPFMKGVVVVK